MIMEMKNQEGGESYVKYEAHMGSELNQPSIIPLKSLEMEQVIAEFGKLRKAHGDNSILKLKLMGINKAGQKVEINVSGY